MCRVMNVSTSGYYAWRSRPESRRSRENRRLAVEIRAIHAESRQTYGSPRVYAELRARGVQCSRGRVERLMRQSGIRARQAKRFRATTDSQHHLPVAENVLDRNFGATDTNRKWAADITYVWTREGWLYLAVVLDLCSRRVIGCAMQAALARGLVVDALRMALQQRQLTGRLLHHSDQGSQYASADYQQLLSACGIACSMSRKGNCYDNAVVESFFGTLKSELVHHCNYQRRAEAEADIFEYLEVWYNRKRRHSSLGYLSPAEYEAQMAMPLAA